MIKIKMMIIFEISFSQNNIAYEIKIWQIFSQHICVLVYIDRMVTETHDRMEQNKQFHCILFQILIPEATLYLSLDPKNFDLGIPDPKPKPFANITGKLWTVLFHSGFYIVTTILFGVSV